MSQVSGRVRMDGGMSPQTAAEIKAGARFPFGENWLRYLSAVTDEGLSEATRSLQEVLRADTLRGTTFLDVGCGSGLFSLAARRLGATVRSLDTDPQSVACTNELKRRYLPGDGGWTIEEGSALDGSYLAGLGEFDTVYCWGVLHHTGDMRRAFSNVLANVAPGGRLYLSVYNDQGWRSRYWSFVKRTYNRNRACRLAVVWAHAPYLFGVRYLVRALRGRSAPGRGMTLWRDTIDWLGGYPFEVAKPDEVFSYFRDRGMALESLKTCRGRMGCNEFLFRREESGRGANGGRR
jgi:2-polyprenyl-3-methyl-5-hydroxy-6-metoxy-1,4-benzoquinol methylase